jgi:hypothetical protein
VRPNGLKLWLYRFIGKRKNMSFRIDDAVTLAMAMGLASAIAVIPG